MTDALATRLANNIKVLRGIRAKTQAQMAKIAGLPRATWANLESGAANPTLSVLHAAAGALSVSLEELLAGPRSVGRHYARDALKTVSRGAVTIRRLLPDPIAGMEIERMELPVGARMTGVPHTTGSREYLTCERGQIELVANADRFVLEAGDVVVFQGDHRHSYRNLGRTVAVGYSVVILVAPHTMA